MKKLKPIIKIAIILVITIILVVSAIFFFKVNKKVYDVEKMTKVFEKNDLKVSDKRIAIKNDKMNTYIEGQSEKENYAADFFIMDNEKAAKKLYEEYTTFLEKEAGGKKGTVVTNKMGYYKYVLESAGNYVVLIRSKNTVLFINAFKSNRKSVDKILKTLKY